MAYYIARRLTNANPDPDTLCLATDSTYILTAADNTGHGPNGLPVITTPITIHGNCATITRDPAAAPFRFFQVATTGNLVLHDLTLSGGATPTVNDALPESDGGAIGSDGTLTVSGSAFDGNRAGDDGGGVHSSTGTLTIAASTFTNNTAGDDGGAIRLYSGHRRSFHLAPPYVASWLLARRPAAHWHTSGASLGAVRGQRLRLANPQVLPETRVHRRDIVRLFRAPALFFQHVGCAED
jgi:hypothetical protein